VGLELLHGGSGVVEEGESSGLATTKLCAETKDGDGVLLALVELRELLAEILLGDIGALGVENVTVLIYLLDGGLHHKRICPAQLSFDLCASFDIL